jgi:hypothetical protein
VHAFRPPDDERLVKMAGANRSNLFSFAIIVGGETRVERVMLTAPNLTW